MEAIAAKVPWVTPVFPSLRAADPAYLPKPEVHVIRLATPRAAAKHQDPLLFSSRQPALIVAAFFCDTVADHNRAVYAYVREAG